MDSLRLQNRVRKICALVAITLILPALAYAQNNQGGNNQGQNNNNQGQNQNNPPRAPEGNAGWVLVPFLGAVLIFSTRQLFRAKAAEKNGC
jgi:hypothetical protein